MDGPGTALNILMNEKESLHGKPVYELIVTLAHDAGLAGATLTRGFLSYGPLGHFHDADIEVMMGELPVSILIVDTSEKIAGFLPSLEGIVGNGLVQTWDVNIELYRHNSVPGGHE